MLRTYIDHLNRKVSIFHPPKRIISLVPSQTELLFYLGLDQEVVGITKFCVHPEHQFRQKTRIGGTKNLHFDKIKALKPDLIIANKEENEQTQIEALSTEFPLWLSDILNLEDALDMIISLGVMIRKQENAHLLVKQIKDAFSPLIPIERMPRKKAAYFIWRKPYMVVGNNTFIDTMMAYAGFDNVFAFESRYPEVSKEEIRDAKPDVLLLSSEPYPFKAQHIAEFQNICPQSVIKPVDGELFSWYGNRLLLAARYFKELREEFY